MEDSLLNSLQISRDCQELEPSIGEQLASLLYLEPDSDLMVLKFQQFVFGCTVLCSISHCQKTCSLVAPSCYCFVLLLASHHAIYI